MSALSTLYLLCLVVGKKNERSFSFVATVICHTETPTRWRMERVFTCWKYPSKISCSTGFLGRFISNTRRIYNIYIHIYRGGISNVIRAKLKYNSRAPIVFPRAANHEFFSRKRISLGGDSAKSAISKYRVARRERPFFVRSISLFYQSGRKRDDFICMHIVYRGVVI